MGDGRDQERWDIGEDRGVKVMVTVEMTCMSSFLYL